MENTDIDDAVEELKLAAERRGKISQRMFNKVCADYLLGGVSP